MDRTLFTPISNGKKESELRDSQGTMLVFLVIPECCQKFTLNTITATKFAKRQNSAEETWRPVFIKWFRWFQNSIQQIEMSSKELEIIKILNHRGCGMWRSLKKKDYFRQGYLPYGDKKAYKTDYLICSDQKNLDWPVEITFKGKVETTVRWGTNQVLVWWFHLEPVSF